MDRLLRQRQRLGSSRELGAQRARSGEAHIICGECGFYSFKTGVETHTIYWGPLRRKHSDVSWVEHTCANCGYLTQDVTKDIDFSNVVYMMTAASNAAATFQIAGCSFYFMINDIRDFDSFLSAPRYEARYVDSTSLYRVKMGMTIKAREDEYGHPYVLRSEFLELLKQLARLDEDLDDYTFITQYDHDDAAYYAELDRQEDEIEEW